MVPTEERKWKWKRNAENGDNDSSHYAPRKMVTFETFVACVICKPPIWQGEPVEGLLRVEVNTLEQLKRRRSQTAEGQQDELPEHLDAGWSTEDAMEAVEPT